jgi:hypothetical protein
MQLEPCVESGIAGLRGGSAFRRHGAKIGGSVMRYDGDAAQQAMGRGAGWRQKPETRARWRRVADAQQQPAEAFDRLGVPLVADSGRGFIGELGRHHLYGQPAHLAEEPVAAADLVAACEPQKSKAVEIESQGLGLVAEMSHLAIRPINSWRTSSAIVAVANQKYPIAPRARPKPAIGPYSLSLPLCQAQARTPPASARPATSTSHRFRRAASTRRSWAARWGRSAES